MQAKKLHFSLVTEFVNTAQGCRLGFNQDRIIKSSLSSLSLNTPSHRLPSSFCESLPSQPCTRYKISMLVIFLVCLVQLRLLLSMAVLYHVNDYLQRAYSEASLFGMELTWAKKVLVNDKITASFQSITSPKVSIIKRNRGVAGDPGVPMFPPTHM